MFNSGYLPAISSYPGARVPQETIAREATNQESLSLVNVDFDSVNTAPDITSVVHATGEVNIQQQETAIANKGLIRVLRHPGTIFKRNNSATEQA